MTSLNEARPKRKPGAGDETWLVLAIVLVFALLFAGDVLTPLGYSVWVFYAVTFLVGLRSRRPTVPLACGIVSVVFITIAFFVSPPGVSPKIAILNRGFGSVTMLIMAVVTSSFVRGRNTQEREDWVKSIVAEVSRAIQGELNRHEIARRVATTCAKYLEAPAVVVYGGDGPQELRPLAASGTEVPTDVPAPVHEVARSNETRRVRTKETIGISSGVARGSTAYVTTMTARAEERVQGVVEVGSSGPLDDTDEELLRRLLPTVGLALRSALYREKLEAALEETQRQAEELQTQQEELRVANEELQVAQQQVEERQHELEATNAELEAQNAELERMQGIAAAKGAEAERASRYKSEFLANMSHELRTPLNSTLLLARQLGENRGGNLTPEQVRWAQTIHSAGQDLLALINDVLDLARVEAGKLEVRPSTVPLDALRDAMLATFEPLAKDKRLTLSAEIAEGAPPSITTDHQRLEQILRNLLSNAVKFTEKGRVSLRIEPVGEEIAFVVEDTGIGIAPEQHEAVFEPFRQADGTTNRKYGGTGLGLSISRDLAQLLGGQLRLESALGKGSRFVLVLPKAYVPRRDERPRRPASTMPAPLPRPEPLRPAVPQEAAPPAKSDGRVVLVVEDDDTFASILVELAREQDFHALRATTAREALEVARGRRPSAVLLDVHLPDGSGLAVLDALKHDPSTRHIPVHVLSGGDYAKAALGMGAVGYVHKPAVREQLVEAFQKLAARISQTMRTVLVVDDDPAQREGLATLLADEGAKVVTVETAAEARKALADGTFDCVVLDLELPDESGFALLDRMAEDPAFSFPPVIVYTGRQLSPEEEQRLRRYSSSIILKGARSPERLLAEVSLFLHQVEAELPPARRRMLRQAFDRETAFEGKRILVAEDDVRNIYALTSVLEPRGATVVVARNGKEALRALDAGPIDLVLMDVMMPEMDGLEATRRIRATPRLRDLPVIAITAKAMADDRQACLDAGANDYIPKPLDLDMLLSLMRVWLRR